MDLSSFGTGASNVGSLSTVSGRSSTTLGTAEPKPSLSNMAAFNSFNGTTVKANETAAADEDDDEGWGDFEEVVSTPKATTAPMVFPPVQPQPQPQPMQNRMSMSNFQPLVPVSKPPSRPTSVQPAASTSSSVSVPMQPSLSSQPQGLHQSTQLPAAAIPKRRSSISRTSATNSPVSATKTNPPLAPFDPLPEFTSVPTQKVAEAPEPSPWGLSGFDVLQPKTPVTGSINGGTQTQKPVGPSAEALMANSSILQPKRSNTPPGVPNVASFAAIQPKAAHQGPPPARPFSTSFEPLQPYRSSTSGLPTVPPPTSSATPSKPQTSDEFDDFFGATTAQPKPMPPQHKSTASFSSASTSRNSTPRPMSLPPQQTLKPSPYGNLDFFDLPPTKPKMAAGLAPSTGSRQQGARETEEDRIVRRVVEGLPDWNKLIVRRRDLLG